MKQNERTPKSTDKQTTIVLQPTNQVKTSTVYKPIWFGGGSELWTNNQTHAKAILDILLCGQCAVSVRSVFMVCLHNAPTINAQISKVVVLMVANLDTVLCLFEF